MRQIRAYLEAIHHHFDGVLLVLLQRWEIVQLVDGAVDTYPYETLGPKLFEELQVFPLPFLDHRCQQHQPAPFRKGHHLIHHLADGLGLQGVTMLGAAGFAGTGEQQTQVVVDLGHRADGGTGIVGGGFLLYGDGR